MQISIEAYNANTYNNARVQLVPPYEGDKAKGSISSNGTHPSGIKSQEDQVTLSRTGRELSEQSSSTREEKGTDMRPLSDEELRTLSDLQQRDIEVKAHEQAHLSVAGQYAAGGASFSYTTGPNGKRYATGGEVPIDVSKESSPDATILKMRTVRRAALAPARPSAADRAIASQASAMEAQARGELQKNAGKTDSESEINSPDSEPDRIEEIIPDTESDMSGYSRRVMNSAYRKMAAMAF